MRQFDTIVIGCGHAGSEAAAASAKLGAKTLMIGLNLDSIAWMPCNPAIGGPAKSQLVKEIDALGGLMGLAADANYLQLKTLNSSRGEAVHALRAQADKYMYSLWMRQTLQKIPNLFLYQGMVTQLLIEKNRVIGIETAIGERIKAKAVIITSGTFLSGKVFTGKNTQEAGRAAEPSVKGLTASLQAYGLSFGRLKTGTPVRLSAKSICFEQLSQYNGDLKPSFFSFLPNRPYFEQLPCYATRSTERTHQIIKENLQESPLYSGLIKGAGPRYCPSIEDKVVRFPEKESHLFFLEPEGRFTDEIYLQGCSTSLPIEVQWQIIHSLPGLEEAQIVRPAYAVEYDFLHPWQFNHHLHCSKLTGLFAAGQLLGTSGYEEAAAQGLVAGINAAKFVQDQAPVALGRASSYLGTLIDDLVIKEITEPYRMLTSRSEHRLYLRQDNADRRLTPLGKQIGLVNDQRWQVYSVKVKKLEAAKKFLEETRIKGNAKTNQVLQKYAQSPLGNNQSITLAELLARPKVTYNLIKELSAAQTLLDEDIAFTLSTDLKYAGYINRQSEQVYKTNNQLLTAKNIPETFDYQKLKHLSLEAREKLSKVKPQTIEQASRIDGVSQADLSILLISLAKTKSKLIKI